MEKANPARHNNLDTQKELKSKAIIALEKAKKIEQSKLEKGYRYVMVAEKTRKLIAKK